MRYRNDEIAPSGHRQYLIAVNIRELELLRGMAGKVAETLPYSEPTARLRSVAQNMVKTLGKAIKEAERLGDCGKRIHCYPVDPKSVI